MIPIRRFRRTSPRFSPAAEVVAEIEVALSNQDDKEQDALDNQAVALVQAASRINAQAMGDGMDVIRSIQITQQYRDALLSESGPQRLAYKFGMDVLIYHGYVLRPEDVDDQGQPRGEDLTRAVRVPDVLARHFGF